MLQTDKWFVTNCLLDDRNTFFFFHQVFYFNESMFHNQVIFSRLHLHSLYTIEVKRTRSMRPI